MAVYVETKSPTWHNALPHVRQANTSIEALVLAALERRGFQGPINSDRWRARPAFLQVRAWICLRGERCVPWAVAPTRRSACYASNGVGAVV